MLMRLSLALILLVTALSWHASPVRGASGSQPPAAQQRSTDDSAQALDRQLLVKIRSDSRARVKSGDPGDTGIPSLDRLNRIHSAKGFQQLARGGGGAQADSDLFGWYVVTLDGPNEAIHGNLDSRGQLRSADARAAKLARATADYSADSSVQAVDLNWVVTADAAPTDPFYASSGSWGQAYPDLWGIRKLNPEAAWNTTTGSGSIVVADVDTGIDRNHPDLAQNIWVNADETPANGLDDDQNGYVDDYYGWNWVSNTPDPMDDNGHGTHTAGTIGAVGNNGQGVVGLTWTTRLMALKFLNGSGSGALDAGISALQYAADNGARVASNSWGCQCQSQALDDAVRYAHDRGVVVVAAAGNSNIDALDFSPASADGAITVAASDPSDLKASFSNWGEKVDVAAPGVDILSTRSSQDTLCAPRNAVVGDIYCRLSGTSMATPHVSGLAALLLSANPSLTVEEVRQLLRQGSVDIGGTGKDASFGYGRISASGSMALASTKPLAPIITSPKSRSTVSGRSLQVLGSISGATFQSYKLEVGAGRAPVSWTTVATSSKLPTNGVIATVDTTTLAEGPSIFRLTALDTAGRSYQFQVNDVEVDNFDAAITMPLTLVAKGSVDVVGTGRAKNGLTLSSYSLEWGAGASPTSWSAAGITLANGGLQPVADGLLARWDTTGLAPGQQYTLRLTVRATSGASTQVASLLTLDADLVSGWPQRLNLNSPLASLPATVPAFADLDGDGAREIVLTETSGSIRAVRKDGTSLPGFPVSVGWGWYPNLPTNLADVDGDGRPELVVSVTNLSWERKILIFRSDGTPFPGWPQPTVMDDTLGDDTPAVVDLDGDGAKELVFADWYGKLHAMRLNGAEVAGFPKQVFASSASSIRPSIVLTDLQRDGRSEILLATNEGIYALDPAGNALPGWPIHNPTYNGQTLGVVASAAGGDVDGDGKLEVFALATTPGCAGCAAYVFGWTMAGTPLAGWPQAVGTLSYNNPTQVALATADVDHDGKDEVVASTSGVYVLGSAGLEVRGGSGSTAPALGDADGDGRVESLTSYDGMLNVVDDSGAVAWSRAFDSAAKSGYAITVPAVMADADGNGRLEVVALWSPFTVASGTGYAFVWELPLSSGQGAAAGQADWPMFQHDPSRSGRLVSSGGPAPTPSPTPTSPPVSTTLHVGDLDGAALAAPKSSWKASVTVLVQDANGKAVGGATVAGTFSQGNQRKASCTTNSAGTCSVTSGALTSTTPSATFVVTGVTRSGYTYDASSNRDPDHSSDGTTIVISR